jgi:hypothetical protein
MPFSPETPVPSHPVRPSGPALPFSPGGFPGWAPPAAAQRPSRELIERPSQPPQRGSMAKVGPRKARGLRPWMLVVGALLMATLAFLVTRCSIR